MFFISKLARPVEADRQVPMAQRAEPLLFPLPQAKLRQMFL
jgi:hypothetical protein